MSRDLSALGVTPRLSLVTAVDPLVGPAFQGTRGRLNLNLNPALGSLLHCSVIAR